MRGRQKEYKFAQTWGDIEDKRWKEFKQAMKYKLGKTIRKKTDKESGEEFWTD